MTSWMGLQNIQQYTWVFFVFVCCDALLKCTFFFFFQVLSIDLHKFQKWEEFFWIILVALACSPVQTVTQFWPIALSSSPLASQGPQEEPFFLTRLVKSQMWSNTSENWDINLSAKKILTLPKVLCNYYFLIYSTVFEVKFGIDC